MSGKNTRFRPPLARKIFQKNARDLSDMREPQAAQQVVACRAERTVAIRP
jgi:hypothetical protein